MKKLVRRTRDVAVPEVRELRLPDALFGGSAGGGRSGTSVARKCGVAIGRVVLLLFAGMLVACQQNPNRTDPDLGPEAVKRALEGKAYWESKCATVAGEKIYRKVENVEGLLLLKVRPKAGDREWADRNWPGAAFARERQSAGYIESFLGYEYSANSSGGPISPSNRGYVITDRRPGGVPGYRWVEVIDETDGQRYRYTGSERVLGRKDVSAPNVKAALQEDPNYDLNIYGYVLERTLATTPAARYAVTFEDHVIPEERYLGIASSTIKVIDQKNDELLGEMTRYAWSGGAPSRANPSPWLTAHRCPDYGVGTDTATRKFVDQVLVPAGEK